MPCRPGRMGSGDFQWGDRWVFPLVPTACSYAKLDEYFGKFWKAEIEVMQTQGDCGEHLEVGEVAKSKNRRLMSKMGNSKAIGADVEDAIRNTFSKWRTLFLDVRGPKMKWGN